MVKPVDQITAIANMVCHSQVPRREARPHHSGPYGKQQGRLGGRETGKDMSKSLYCDFQRKEKIKQGKQAEDWLAWIVLVGSGG